MRAVCDFPRRELVQERLEKNDAIEYYVAVQAEREKILQRLRAGLPALKREFPLHGLALFGSMVDFVTLADKLEELTGRKIDLVSRRAIKPLLWKQIESELIDV